MIGGNGENGRAGPSNDGDAHANGGHPVTTPSLDAEKIAALLDGRLKGAERDYVLAALADSEEWSGVFADAASATQEAEAASTPVIPIYRSRRIGRTGMIALAATIVGLALIPTLAGRFGGAADSPAALLTDARGGLPRGWEDHPWSEVRSEGDVLVPEARAVRVGILVAELQVAAAANDPAARPLAEQAAALVEGAPAGAAAASLFRDGAGEVRRARQEAARLLGEEAFAAGEWLGAARIAAAREDHAFFAAARSRRILSRPPGTRAPDAWGRARQGSGPPPRWPALRAALDEIVAAY
jgi:hypothetical protein